MQTTSTSSSPAAFIAVGRDKNRLKIYGNQKVYLENGQEFMIELFNPTTNTVGAKIFINGKAISERMIVLRPGSREWLKRHIDHDSKFVYNTYEVEDSPEAKAAIATNGFVRVEFYKEYQPQPMIYSPTWTYHNGIYGGNGGSFPFNGTTIGGSGQINLMGVSTTTDSAGSGKCFTASTNFMRSSDLSDTTKGIETGRIEAGAASGQKLDSYNGTFESWSSYNTEYQILPTSQQPVEVSKIREYCPNCRSRIRKSSWNFCPACSEDLRF